MREFTGNLVKNNYELEKKDIKALVVFAHTACDELLKYAESAEKANTENVAIKDYVDKVVKFLNAKDTLQPSAKDFATFLLAKARSFK
jgi:hypothetical protein